MANKISDLAINTHAEVIANVITKFPRRADDMQVTIFIAAYPGDNNIFDGIYEETIDEAKPIVRKVFEFKIDINPAASITSDIRKGLIAAVNHAYNSMKEDLRDQYEYAIGSNLVINADGAVYFRQYYQLDLKIVHSPFARGLLLHDFRQEEILATGSSYHIVTDRPHCTQTIFASPELGLVDSAWAGIRDDIYKISYLRVTHNVKPDLEEI